MAMRESLVTATIAGGANQQLTFTLQIPNVPAPILQYFVSGDSADGTLFPVPYQVSAQLDSGGTLGAGISLPSPQDLELYSGGFWVASGAQYLVSGAGVSYLTSNFAYSATTRDLSTLLAPTPAVPYPTAAVTLEIPPLAVGQVVIASAALSTPCLYGGSLVVPSSSAFSTQLASDGTGTLDLIPNALLVPVNSAIAASDVVWQVNVAGVSVPIRVPVGGGSLVSCLVEVIGGHVVGTPATPTLGFAEITL